MSYYLIHFVSALLNFIGKRIDQQLKISNRMFSNWTGPPSRIPAFTRPTVATTTTFLPASTTPANAKWTHPPSSPSPISTWQMITLLISSPRGGLEPKEELHQAKISLHPVQSIAVILCLSYIFISIDPLGRATY